MILELKKVAFKYGSEKTIEDVSLFLKEGELLSLIGPNGCGKSTLLKLACGILKPNSGSIRLFSREASLYSDKERASLISYLPQIFDMNVPFTVKELVKMGTYSRSPSSMMDVDEALDTVGLTEKKDLPLMNLSGGERRRAYVAMTLVQGSRILLLDEPFSNIDIKYQVELLALLKKVISQKGISVIMALHDINTVMKFDCVTVMKDGAIAASGDPQKILTPALIKEVFEVEFKDLMTGLIPAPEF